MLTWPFRRSAAKKLPTRSRIFASALLMCSIIGAIDMPLPLEGVFRGVRNELRARPADQSIVVAAIDAKTIRAFGTSTYSRAYNATLLDRAFSAGAQKVYFDEAFSMPLDRKGDEAFAKAIARNEGKVFSGAMYFRSRETGLKEEILPAPIFKDVTRIRSLNGAATPFALSAQLAYADTFEGKFTPSVSADIAGYKGPAGKRYLPDWTIQVRSALLSA